MQPIIDAVAAGRLSWLDLWHATITPQTQASSSSSSSSAPSSKKGKIESSDTAAARRFTFCCFFSVGFDANISHRFTMRRERFPSTCRYAWQNKAWYAWYGAAEAAAGRRFITSQNVDLFVDGAPVVIPGDVNTVQVFSIHSSADGVDFWRGALETLTRGRLTSLSLKKKRNFDLYSTDPL